MSIRETANAAPPLSLESEKDFSQTVFNLARMLGWLAVRFPTWRATGTTPGYPDLTMVRGNRLIFAELKGPRGKVSAVQDEWLTALASAGAETYKWWPKDWEQIKEVLQ